MSPRTTNRFRCDAGARIATSNQTSGGVDYAFEYGYQKGWGLQQVKYPSGRWVRYTPDAAALNGWNQCYGYDRIGNRWVAASGLPVDPPAPHPVLCHDGRPNRASDLFQHRSSHPRRGPALTATLGPASGAALPRPEDQSSG